MDSTIAIKYPLGSKPKISFVPWIIVCSYLVSLVGAFTTVELLHRRISGAGWRSWYDHVDSLSFRHADAL